MILEIIFNYYSQPLLCLLFIVFSALAVILAFSVHECSHGLMALALGDKTAKYEGRLTLNPFAHMSWLGFLLLMVLGFGWGRPVNVRAARFKHPRLGMALTAFAGPLSNFIFAFISCFCYLLVSYKSYLLSLGGEMKQAELLSYIATFFIYLLSINLSLGLFNLIPLPPLDGSKILGECLPLSARIKYYSIERYSMIIFIALIILLNRTGFLGILANWVLSGFETVLLPLVELIFA